MFSANQVVFTFCREHSRGSSVYFHLQKVHGNASSGNDNVFLY